MNKKLNTALFVLAATVVNIILVLIVALALFALYAFTLAKFLPPAVNLVALVVIVVGAMAASFPLYRWGVMAIEKRFKLEEYFEPIFPRKRR